MKNWFSISCLLILGFVFNSCIDGEQVDWQCVADVAVTALDAPAAVQEGDVIQVVCVIKNLITTANGCSSGEGTIEVERAYSPTFREYFSEYESVSKQFFPMESLEAGYEREDVPMLYETYYGKGWYAMKVTVNAENNTPGDNDTRAVAVNVN